MLPSSKALAATAFGAASLHALPAAAAASAGARRALAIADSVAGERAVALTFDDGPHPQGTPTVLDELATAGARATFFLVGEQVERWPGLAAEIVAAGHGVALHGHTHRWHLRLTRAAVAEDLRRGVSALGEATGHTPRLHRPPYGQYSTASLCAVRRAGLAPVLWSRHGRDWSRRATPTSIAARLEKDLSPGETLLLHDADHYAAPGSWKRTATALPGLLRRLQEAGLEPVALSV